MAITTTDVITNVSNLEVIKNGTTIVSCQVTGISSKIDPTYQQNISYGAVESKYTSRFYNNIDNLKTVDGGPA